MRVNSPYKLWGAKLSKPWKPSIAAFLNGGKEKELKDALRINWFDFYPEDKMEIFHFLHLAHQYKLFLYFFAIDLQSQITDLPWISFLQILETEQINIPETHFEEMIRNFKKQQLISSKASTKEDVISELKEKRRFRFLQRVTKHKQELIASARIAETEQLMEQHITYMNELKKIAPKEFRLKSLISDQEKRKAEQIIRNRVNRSLSDHHEDSQVLDREELELINKIKQQAGDFLKTKQANPSDIAYLFRTLGDGKAAVDFIYQNEDESKKDWQLLDYLFNGKQYVALLDHCQMLKDKYSEKPDALFSISYAESIAYWELGEKEKAYDLMKQISSMRPNFKSASETLAQWGEDGFE